MKQNSLYNLIHTLTRSEKRYIRLQAKAMHSKDTEYMVLYDLLSNMKTYDEKVLQKKFSKLNSKRNLTSLKNYLYYEILDILKNYHKSSSLEMEILNKFHSIKILYLRGLTDDAYSLIQKLKKKLLQLQCFEYYLIGLLKIENVLILTLNKNVPVEQEILLQEWENAINISYEHLNIRKLHHEYFNSTYTYNPLKTKRKNDFLNHPTLIKSKEFTHLKAKTKAKLIQIDIFLGLQELDKVQELLVEFVQEIELVHSENFHYTTELFILVLAIKIEIALQTKDSKAFLTHYQELHEQISIEPLNTLVFRGCYGNLFQAVHKDMQVPELLDWQIIKNNLYQIRSSCPIASFFILITMGTIALVKLQKYQTALSWIKMYYEIQKQRPFQNYFFCISILSFICHYKLNNYRLIGSILSNVRQQFKRYKQTDQDILLILSYFNKMVKYSYKTSDEKKQILLDDFKEKIQGIETKKLQKYFLIEEAKSWLIQEIDSL